MSWAWVNLLQNHGTNKSVSASSSVAKNLGLTPMFNMFFRLPRIAQGSIEPRHGGHVMSFRIGSLGFWVVFRAETRGIGRKRH